MAVIALACVLVGAGCSSDRAVVEYGPENRHAFMAACSDLLADSLMIRDVCDCVFTSVHQAYAVTDLGAIDERLRLDALAEPPEEVVGFVAECFINEAGL